MQNFDKLSKSAKNAGKAQKRLQNRKNVEISLKNTQNC